MYEFGKRTGNKKVEKHILYIYLRFLKNVYRILWDFNCSIKEKAEIRMAIKKYYEFYYPIYIRNDENLAISGLEDFALRLFREFPLLFGFLITKKAKCDK